MQRLAAKIEQVVNRLNYTFKIINNDTIKIILNKLEYHKAIIDIIKEKKVKFHNTNLGNNMRTEW
jgi:predicted transcriptional regulator